MPTLNRAKTLSIHLPAQWLFVRKCQVWGLQIAEPVMGWTNQVQIVAFSKAYSDLETSRRRYCKARMALASARNKLDQVIDDAYQHQSFGPLESLFCEEEVALANYEEAVAILTEAEEHWCALRAAIASERVLMTVEPSSRQWLN